MALPGNFDTAVSSWLAEHGQGSHREATAALTRSYRSGGTSATIDLAAYLVARLPAIYAAVARVLAEVKRLQPAFAPRSLLDAGAGPGTASWAAAACWASLESICLFDNNRDFLDLASWLARLSGHKALLEARSRQGSVLDLDAPPADLVIASYALAELPKSSTVQAALALWRLTGDTLLLVEPGTPDGFARILAARKALLEAGAFPVAPCPHSRKCPIVTPDWCHFSVRLARSRAHLHAKAANVPFEDEKFSYLAVSRKEGPLPRSRIVAPPRPGKAGIGFTLCTEEGLQSVTIARRNRDAYKRARKLDWGDSF
ncbi:MAG: SAM-dependent methyltransferase [Rhizobiales bacterium]|nr:SAM-dependent methyltransferase [Hyphomicrobiales bacterium]